VQQFLALFHRYDYIFKDTSASQWTSPKGNWRLDDSAILKAISLQNKKYLIGTRAGRKTRYAVIDIDSGSKYHNQNELQRLLEALAAAGLSRSSLYRSSMSDGWHLYLFFEEAISSTIVYQQLVRLLKLNEFEVKPGTLEVFPHPGYSSVGMGLRLPLQAGFAWLDKRTLEVDHYREEMTATKALEWFLDSLESDANSYADFLQLKAHVQNLELAQGLTAKGPGANNVVSIRRAPGLLASGEATLLVTSVFGHLPININADNWQKGRQFYLQGLTENSQRATAAFCLGHYLFYGDPSRNLPALGYGCVQERETVIQDFLNSQHNGFSKEINRGRPGAFSQVTRMVNCLPFHKRGEEVKVFTPVVPESWVRENAKRKDSARRRIQDALTSLQIRKRPFSTVELQKAAGCARDTLYKHADIWRQEYEDLASEFFTACPDEYNSLKDSSEPVSSIPQDVLCSSVSTKEVPIGLIVARQVIFELSQKGKVEKFVREATVLKNRDDVEQAWRKKVAGLTERSPKDLLVLELKTKLYMLRTLLSTAPYEEEAQNLLTYIRALNLELSSRKFGLGSRNPSPDSS